MKFCFDKPTCQNIRKSLRKEWLETNGLGDYAASSLICCNTRKYHGLLVANLKEPAGRHVLLSAVEETLLVAGREFSLSCRKHPGVYYPRGHEYLQGMEIGEWPRFHYRIGDLRLTRELMLMPGKHLVVLRYEVRCEGDDTPPPMTLRVRPLLAFRHFHTLTTANVDLQVKTSSAPQGFKIQPYNDLPPLWMQVGGKFKFYPSPDWYHQVEYLLERERGFADKEDLFQPGVFDIKLTPGEPVYLAASTEGVPGKGADRIAALWEEERTRRLLAAPEAESLEGHLAREGAKFFITNPQGEPQIIAGYHWFDAWGRDTFIALPGLTFCAGRTASGVDILLRAGAAARDGLIPNCYAPDGNHAYNSVDASLWYIWAVQQMLLLAPGHEQLVREQCWPLIKNIIDAYASSRIPHVRHDEDGFLHVGGPDTQLTWMDANAYGKPVTPRNGVPVEIQALWYNALTFASDLARKYGEDASAFNPARLAAMRALFVNRFWVRSSLGDYLADVWRPEEADIRVRPNQIFAVSLPCPILDEEHMTAVVERITTCLLTPYGLRSLAPSAFDYHPHYEGGPDQRDSAYHRGTVWPWLLGAYTDGLLKTSWEPEVAVAGLLNKLRPLFAQHLGDAGMGSISEVFDGDPPHLHGGCVAQAWSVAECLRLLRLCRQAAPTVYERWEADARKGGK